MCAQLALAEPVNINQRVFVYFLLKSDIIHKQYEMIANGSSQQNLSPIEAEKVIIAYNPEVATKFSTLCNEYLNTIVSNLAENQELINMPIEQLQQLLGHRKIDTTLQYAMVKQSNVKLAHRKYIG